MADSTFNIELALRSGRLAKAALELHGMTSPSLALLQMRDIVNQVRELDERIRLAQKTAHEATENSPVKARG